MPTLVDAGAIVAVLDRRDPGHRRVLSFLERDRDEMLVPVTVLPEADYLVVARHGVRAELVMLRGVAGTFELVDFTADDLGRAIELIEQYAEAEIGLVDASVVAIAERLRITRILTLDRRRFSFIKPRHCAALELVP
ncbi:MAG TPA: PIN domain-containing protein [Chloroflexota bacterium]|nr:PIN domain-containing protein [Chloroflexota bacterium]